MTGDKVFALVLCGLSTMATAYFTSRPKLIAAQAAREAARYANKEHSQATLIQNLHYEIERKTAEIGLIRISKHNALNALQAAYWHVDELHQMCNYAQPRMELPSFTKVSIKEIFGDEDEQLRDMITTTMQRRADRES